MRRSTWARERVNGGLGPAVMIGGFLLECVVDISMLPSSREGIPFSLLPGNVTGISTRARERFKEGPFEDLSPSLSIEGVDVEPSIVSRSLGSSVMIGALPLECTVDSSPLSSREGIPFCLLSGNVTGISTGVRERVNEDLAPSLSIEGVDGE